jgi:hypothetical protein
MAVNLDNGCPPATLAQCQDPDFLYGTRCGQLERERADSRCARLLQGAMDSAARTQGEEISVMPRAIQPSGIDRVVRDRTPPPNAAYVPDLLSFHSRQAASGHVATMDFGINEYDLWRSNGAGVQSCREYVWEKFGDINEFLHATRGRRQDGRALFRTAYGPASSPASIGTRHLQDPHLRGRDGRVFGRMLDALPRPRNRYYTVPNFPGYSREFPIPTEVPGLLDSLASRSAAGRQAVQRILQARAAGTDRVLETWAWHRDMPNRMVREPATGPRSITDIEGTPPPRGFMTPALLAAAGALTALLPWLLPSAARHAPQTPGALPSALAAAGPRLHWQAGETLHWRVSMDARTQLQVPDMMPGGPADAFDLDAHFGLDGVLAVQVVDTTPDGHARMQVWLRDLERASLRLGEAPDPGLAALTEVLRPVSLTLQVDPCGRVHAWSPDLPDHPGTPMLHAVVFTGWPVVCGPGGTFDIERTTPLGHARETLRAREEASGTWQVTVEARHYRQWQALAMPHDPAPVSLEAATDLRAGRVHRHALTETVAWTGEGGVELQADTRWTLVPATDVAAGPAPRPATHAWQAADGPVQSAAAARRAMLEARADGLDGDTLEEVLASFGVTGTLPDHNRTLWRAPARLALEPQRMGRVVELAIDAETSPSGRALMLDLLAWTPHPEAGVALLEALQHPQVHAERTWPLLLQRASFVEAPAPALVTWVQDRAHHADHASERWAARTAAGALTHALDLQGNTDLANTLQADLERWATAATDAQERVHGLRALANTRRQASGTLLVASSFDAEAAVRAAAASSLTDYLDAEATEALLRLLGDAEPGVQREAIASLHQRPLTTRTLGRVHAVVSEGHLDPGNALALLDLLKYQIAVSPTLVHEAAQVVADQASDAQVVAAALELQRWTLTALAPGR